MKATYAATTQEGAVAMFNSKANKRPIRVFRSSELKTVYKAVPKDNDSATLRYDGLYSVSKVYFLDENGRVVNAKRPGKVCSSSDPNSRPVYMFDLVRIKAGKGELANSVACEKFARFCIKRGSLFPEAGDVGTQEEAGDGENGDDDSRLEGTRTVPLKRERVDPPVAENEWPELKLPRKSKLQNGEKTSLLFNLHQPLPVKNSHGQHSRRWRSRCRGQSNWLKTKP